MAAERVFIVGGMGSGKSTLAAEIGRRTGCRFTTWTRSCVPVAVPGRCARPRSATRWSPTSRFAALGGRGHPSRLDRAAARRGRHDHLARPRSLGPRQRPDGSPLLLTGAGRGAPPAGLARSSSVSATTAAGWPSCRAIPESRRYHRELPGRPSRHGRALAPYRARSSSADRGRRRGRGRNCGSRLTKVAHGHR